MCFDGSGYYSEWFVRDVQTVLLSIQYNDDQVRIYGF